MNACGSLFFAVELPAVVPRAGKWVECWYPSIWPSVSRQRLPLLPLPGECMRNALFVSLAADVVDPAWVGSFDLLTD